MPHISSLGRYKDSRGVVKTPSRNKAGYTTIIIQKKKYQTHRVVAIAFGLQRGPGQTQVNHINRVPGDDRLENLEWATPAENTRHSRATNPDRKSSAPKAIEARPGPDGRVRRAVDVVPVGQRGRARAPGPSG